MTTWPPTLDELKVSQKLPLTPPPNQTPEDAALDDEQLMQGLDGAVAFVERVRKGSFNFAMESGSSLPDPPDDFRLGVLRLAYRWHLRYRSPDGLVSMAEAGTSRVASFDPDIDRQLGIGKYRSPVFA